jgi:hypothetical protein
MLPELARESIEAGARMARRHEAEPATAQAAEDLVFFALKSADLLERAWSSLARALERGVEGREATATARATLTGMDVWLVVHDICVRVADRAGATHIQGLTELGHARAAVQARRADVENVLMIANRPFPPVDEARLRQGTQEAQEGRAENTRLLLERLRRGEDV